MTRKEEHDRLIGILNQLEEITKEILAIQQDKANVLSYHEFWRIRRLNARTWEEINSKLRF